MAGLLKIARTHGIRLPYVLYARHYNPRFISLVYILFTPFLKAKNVFLRSFFHKILTLCTISIQERFQIKSGLQWRAYGIYFWNISFQHYSISFWSFNTFVPFWNLFDEIFSAEIIMTNFGIENGQYMYWIFDIRTVNAFWIHWCGSFDLRLKPSFANFS